MTDNVQKLFVEMKDKNASDIHITANSPIHFRIDEELVKVNDNILTPDETKTIAYSLMSDFQKKKFEEEKELDFSFSLEDMGRFRVNIFMQRFCVGCAIRRIPPEIMSIEECGLPIDVVKGFCHTPKGLVLVTGATGSGKSTTLAAMVDEINKTRKCHIVTVEDPIEFVHQNKQAVVDQREVFSDTFSFNNALRNVLRQDPDVILIGELRDLETIQQAMIIADTGHLVLGTLHTSDSVQTINRIIDVFPSHQQRQIRVQLSFVLTGLISQQLIQYKDGSGMELATEILVATPAIRSMIREDKVHQIYSIMQTSQNLGMRTMNQALFELYSAGKISYDSAISKSGDVEELLKMIEKI